MPDSVLSEQTFIDARRILNEMTVRDNSGPDMIYTSTNNATHLGSVIGDGQGMEVWEPNAFINYSSISRRVEENFTFPTDRYLSQNIHLQDNAEKSIEFCNSEGKKAKIKFDGEEIVYEGDLPIHVSAKMLFESIFQMWKNA